MEWCRLLELKNVSYSYDEKNAVLKDLDLSISGEGLTGVFGPNGSGKTTLGKLACGILQPTAGKVLLQGEDISGLALGEIGQSVGYLFQEPERQLFAPTVEEELSFILRVQGVDDDDIARRVDEMLSYFHLKNLRDSFPFNLSRGEKQRLALAAVLINQPEFLILDEPTTALDVKRKKELSEMLDILLEEGVGMMVISHDHQFVHEHASKIIRLSGGEVNLNG